MSKRARLSDETPPYSVSSSSLAPSLSRSASDESLDAGLGELLGPPGLVEFAMGTSRPNAPTSPTRRPRQPPLCIFPWLPRQSTEMDVPVLRIYLDVTGNVQPGAIQMKASADNNLVAFVPAMSDETLTQPDIFFMPTVKLTTKGLKAGGSEPMQVLGSFANYKEFIETSKPTESCEPTRPKLFDNVKANIKYVIDLYFPVGGKVTLPQNIPGSQGVQGYEKYRIDSVNYRDMPLPKSSRGDDTRQTAIADLQNRLKEAETKYNTLKSAFEEGQEASERSANDITETDVALGKLNDELEALETRTKANKILVDKLSKKLADQLPDNLSRIAKLQTAVNALDAKYPPPRTDSQEAAYNGERRSLKSQILILEKRGTNIEFYLNDGLDWSANVPYQDGATQAMKEYSDAKHEQYKANAEKDLKAGEVNAMQASIRAAQEDHNINQQGRRTDKNKVENARTELFKAQEQLNAVKGGWQIDRSQNASEWWVVTNDGFAFPRVYTILLDLRVSYIGDTGEGEDTFWGLDCIGKGQSIDRRLTELMGRNPKAPFKIFEEFIKAYNPPWSPFAAPAAYTSPGRRTAETRGSLEAQAELRLKRQHDMHAAQQRVAQQALSRRGGPTNPQANTYITMEALQALGIPRIQPPLTPTQVTPGVPPVAAAPLGQQPLGQQPLGQQPLGQQPLGQQPPLFEFGAHPSQQSDFSQPPSVYSASQSPTLSPRFANTSGIASRIGDRPGRGQNPNPTERIPNRGGGKKRTRRRKSRSFTKPRHKRRHSRRKPSTK